MPFIRNEELLAAAVSAEKNFFKSAGELIGRHGAGRVLFGADPSGGAVQQHAGASSVYRGGSAAQKAGNTAGENIAAAGLGQPTVGR